MGRGRNGVEKMCVLMQLQPRENNFLLNFSPHRAIMARLLLGLALASVAAAQNNIIPFGTGLSQGERGPGMGGSGADVSRLMDDMGRPPR